MSPWTWTLFAVYLAVTAWLAWRGGQKSDDATGFAIGSGRMSPWMAGLTLGACLASSAMFVIMPGFVYAEGLPALIGFSVPLSAGLAVGLLVLAPRFQALGGGAVTVPDWLGRRYQSLGLRRLFAALNVLQLAYLVLIVVGCAYVMSAALGLEYRTCAAFVVVFVFGYTAFGGTWAHAFTNSAQAVVMLFVAVLIAGIGLSTWTEGSALAVLGASGWTAPGSKLFSTSFEVWALPFLMGVALTTQPHLLTKALYVDGRGALLRTVAIGMGSFLVFSLVLLAGVYARVELGEGVAQDQVMAIWLVTAFPWPALGAVVSVAILAASMSTLDGLLVAVSASMTHDLFPGRASVRLNRVVLVSLAVLTLGLAWSPPQLVLIFGQLGVYGLVAASTGPLLAGLFRAVPPPPRQAAASAVVALVVHFGVAGLELTSNPGMAALAGLLASLPVALWRTSSARSEAPLLHAA